MNGERRRRMFAHAAKLASDRADAHGREGKRIAELAYEDGVHVQTMIGSEIVEHGPRTRELLEQSNDAYDRSHREHRVWEAATAAAEEPHFDW